MAYLPEDEDNQAQGMNGSAAGQNAAPGNIQPSAPADSGASSGPVPTAAAPKPASSGMSAGFANYANANVGAAQNRLNQAAAGNVQRQGQQAQTAINQAQSAFNKRVDQGSLANRQQALQDVAGTISAARNLTAPGIATPPNQNSQQINSVAQAGENKANAKAFRAQNPNFNPGLVQQGAASQGQLEVARQFAGGLQQAQPTQVPAPAAAPEAAPAINPLEQLNQDQVKRFQDVINARYQGPESLRQAGLYQLASGKVGQAQTALNQAKTAGGREELLRNMFQNRADYTRGLNKLDAALLNSSQRGVQGVQNAAKAQGNLQSKLEQAQLGSTAQAQNRAGEIQGIQEQARKAFGEGKTAEEAATEARLTDIQKHWNELPDYFKNAIGGKEAVNKEVLANQLKPLQEKLTSITGTPQYAKSKAAYDAVKQKVDTLNRTIANINPSSSSQTDLQTRDASLRALKSLTPQLKKAEAAYLPLQKQANDLNSQISGINADYDPNKIQLNPFEAAVLGVNEGQGLYNLGQNAIKTNAADKERLVSRDEQLRQAALASLAGLDQSRRLDTNLQYTNAGKAGTQTALDALDLAGTRNAISEAEKNFQQSAEGTNLTGIGKKKVSRGNLFGKKTKTYTAKVGGNAGDFLKKAGYDMGAPENQGDVANQQELLKAALKASQKSDNGKQVDIEDANSTLGGTAAGAGTGASLGAAGGPIGAGIGAVAGGSLGAYLGSGTVDPYQQYSDILKGYVPAVGTGIQDIRGAVGGAFSGMGGDIGKGIGGAISGIDSGAMKAFGSAIAKQKAVEDLKNKYSQYLNNQGFGNRIDVANNEALQSRLGGLQSLLSKLDKTNT